jgi:hypothetical protein
LTCFLDEVHKQAVDACATTDEFLLLANRKPLNNNNNLPCQLEHQSATKQQRDDADGVHK